MATAKKVPAKKAVKKVVAKKVAAKKTVITKSTAKVIAPKSLFGKAGAFDIAIDMNGEKFGGKTDQIAAAIQSVAPDKINTKVIMHFSLTNKKQNDKVIERVFNIHMARRIFINTMAATILEKAIKLGLGYNGEKN